MHAKYALLHFSYSAPVRVCDMTLLVSVAAARATTTGVALRADELADALLVRLADDGRTGCADRAAFCVFVVVLVRFAVLVAGRRTLLRCVVVRLIGWVETTRCAVDAVRAVALPSRIAALTFVAVSIHKAKKIRILLISGFYVSKIQKIRASKKKVLIIIFDVICCLVRWCGQYDIVVIFITGKCMNKSRLEAFSDGLFAVIITIMVLELQAPESWSWGALRPLIPIFLSYVLSFVYGAVFWINHHYLLTATRRISNGVLWANLNFLFWLSLIPFFTAWVDENHFNSVPVAAYGMALFMVFVSYRVLELILLRIHDADAPIVRALCRGGREKASIIIMLVAVLLSFVHPLISMAIYVGLVAWWVIPTRAMRRAVADLNLMARDTEKK